MPTLCEVKQRQQEGVQLTQFAALSTWEESHREQTCHPPSESFAITTLQV
jgi:hypothetical protein